MSIKDIEAGMAELSKAVGENHEVQSVTEFLDTGCPQLNKILSGSYKGGLPYGRIIEMAGPESSGKTALVTDWMISAQKAGGIAIFIDWEKSFDVDMAIEQGLNTQRPYWFYFRPDNWEDGHELVEDTIKIIRTRGMIPATAPILVAYDSVAQVPARSMQFDQKGNRKKLSDLTMNDSTALARAISLTMKLIPSFVAENNAIYCYLNQIREKPGVTHGDSTYTPGGKAMGFACSVRLSLSRTILKDDKTKEVEGQDIRIHTKKNKLTGFGKETVLRLHFEDDGMAVFDKGYSLVDHLTKLKVLSLSGAYIEWDGKKLFKSQLGKLAQSSAEVYARLVSMLDDAAEPEALPLVEVA